MSQSCVVLGLPSGGGAFWLAAWKAEALFLAVPGRFGREGFCPGPSSGLAFLAGDRAEAPMPGCGSDAPRCDAAAAYRALLGQWQPIILVAQDMPS